MPLLANAGYSVLVPDMRGYGDSDKPAGVEGYDGRGLAEEVRSLAKEIGFGAGRRLFVVAHDMGAPPAFLWAANYPDEVAGLIYAEAPVMLHRVLEKIIVYAPEPMANGSMWWWVLPLAPGVPEALIVGKEREFMNLFFQGPAVARPDAIPSESLEEYLRTFSGRDGVLGALGVYRAAFTTIEQTEPSTKRKLEIPVVAMGGENGLGAKVGELVAEIANNVRSFVVPGCGHFIPEEDPQAILEQIRQLTEATNSTFHKAST